MRACGTVAAVPQASTRSLLGPRSHGQETRSYRYIALVISGATVDLRRL